MEALIKKRIEQAAREIVELSQFLSDFPHDKESVVYGALEMAKWLLSHQWISVEEALPPRDESISYTATSVRVLVRIDFEGIIQHRTAVYDYSLKKWSMYDKGVTHWMPIPQLKGGK